VREAVQRWLAENGALGHLEGEVSAHSPAAAEPSAGPGPVPTLPRTKAAYQGTASAIRPMEGQRLGETRKAGALLGQAPAGKLVPSRPK
jgi:hypothetical protein